MDFKKMQPIKEVLDKKEKKRDEIRPLTQEMIIKSRKGIRLLHQGKITEGGNLIAQAKVVNKGSLRKILREYPDLYYSGIHDAQKELAEGMIFFSILSDLEIYGQEKCRSGLVGIPTPEELGVEYPAYLNGLGDVVGELKRYVQICLIKGDLETAQQMFNLMEEILSVLMEFTQHDKVTGGLRHTIDTVVCRSIEVALGKLTDAAIRKQDQSIKQK